MDGVFPATTIPSDGEFIDLGDTVIDTRTGLEWLTIPDFLTYIWEDALARVSDLNQAGHNDWRLPNVLEAASILKIPNCVDGDLVPSVPHAAFLDLFPHEFVEWTFWLSDTSVYVNSSAWTINFKHGIVHDLNGSNKTTNRYRVLAVRSGL